NDALHPCITGGDQNVQRARDVEFIGRQRIIDAAGHRWQRRLMKYVVHALKDRLERLTIGDADLVYFEVAVQMRDILAFACAKVVDDADAMTVFQQRSEEHTSELQSRENLVCRLLLEKKKKTP